MYPHFSCEKRQSTKAVNSLERSVPFAEIKVAIFQMEPNKAPGLDTFNAHFVQKN